MHGIWGGFYILHPSEYLAEIKGKFSVTWGIGELGLRAIEDTSNDYIYPFAIDSKFDNSNQEVSVKLEAFSIRDVVTYTKDTVLSNLNQKETYKIPLCRMIKITVENSSIYPVYNSTIIPVFTHIASV
jgi:hypothetical protein